MDLKNFEQLPLMGILRAKAEIDAESLAEALVFFGLKTLEITMNSHDAAGLISRVKKAVSGKLSLGAGTVLSVNDMGKALDAGAEFIVMPCQVPEVSKYCKAHGIPVFPGAFTPQEVWNAWESGASMVKVFPSSMFGPKYFKELKGPFNKVKLMAVGGVRSENISEYFRSGASAVAFGGSVFKQELIEKSDYTAIGATVKQYVDAVKAAIQ